MDESKNLLSGASCNAENEELWTVEPSASLEPVPSTSSSRKRLHVVDESSPAKKRRVEHSVQKSVGNTFATVSIPTRDAIDLNEFLNSAKDEICSVISNELVERKALKFYLSVNLELERNSVDGEVTTTTPYLHSLPSVVLESSDLEEQFQTASERLKDLLDVFQGEGSGFTLKSVQECTVNVATYDVIGGSSFIELPAYIQNKKATVNIKNTDDKCFLYSLSYVRNPPNSNVPNQTVSLQERLAKLQRGRSEISVFQLNKFQNSRTKIPEFSVNVYAVDEEKGEKSCE